MARDNDADREPQPTFEQAVEQLEALIEQIESGEVGLEQAIEHYTKGTALIQRCRAILDAAQRRIAELTDTGDGGLVVAEEDDADEGETP